MCWCSYFHFSWVYIPKWNYWAKSFWFNFFRFILFYVYECFVYMDVCAPHVCLVPKEFRTGCRIPATGITDSFKLPYLSILGASLGPMSEQVLVTTELSLHVLCPWLLWLKGNGLCVTWRAALCSIQPSCQWSISLSPDAAMTGRNSDLLPQILPSQPLPTAFQIPGLH